MTESVHGSIRALLLSLICTSTTLADDRCARGTAELISAQGHVEVRASGTDAWQPVASSTPLCAGDMLTVRRGGRAVVRLIAEQTNVRLGENSTLAIPAAPTSGVSIVELFKGIAHFISRVPRALNVKTPFVNAAVEGTEFVVKVDDHETLVAVSEGKVKASSNEGEQVVTSGENVLAPAKGVPRKIAIENPMDVVQWALYYPPIMDFHGEEFTLGGSEGWRATASESVAAYRDGDLKRAIERLAEVPDDALDERLPVYRASLLLATGRVSDAQKLLSDTLRHHPRNSDAIALQSVIATVHNQRDVALTLAREALAVAPDASAPLLAMSYAQQARFELDAALAAARHASQKHPTDALAWARRAELHMMHGALDEAEDAAGEAVKHNARSASAQTILGFALLTQVKLSAAVTRFEHAIAWDQAAPLPRLGLGLTHIRRGDLTTGRALLEAATSLDPRNSLLRSYVGKAYYEEQRDPLASQQFATAKELDPNDPTPWFYNALMLQAQGRPGEALRELEQSISRNDNRAMYRSRLLMDSDLAARNASQAVVYKELGLDQVALETAYASVSADPGNFAAHRFLADAFGAMPRSDIARVSEVLQSQLLQPLSAAPLSAQLAEGNATMASYTSASVLPGYNEYSSLFLQPRPKFHVTGLLGNQNTRGGDVAAAAEFYPVSLSAGAYRFDTDGYRNNADLTHEVKYAFLQAALTPRLSAQMEVRDSELDHGDVVLRFGADNFRPNFRETVDSNSMRVGVHASFGPADDLVVSWIRNENDTLQTDLTVYPDDPVSSFDALQQSASGQQWEAQYLHRGATSKVIVGGGQVHVNANTEFTVGLIDTGTVIDSFVLEDSRDSIRHNNLYVYVPMELSDALQITAGASTERYDSRYGDHEQFNPKLGITWRPSPATTLRSAYMRGLKRPILNNQTLEPTQLAGFNQFFDDTDATDARRYGFGGSHRVGNAWFTGFEAVRRNTTRYVFSNGEAAQGETQTENSGRVYVAWLPLQQLAVSLSYHEMRFERSASGSGSLLEPAEATTRNLPVSLNFNHGSGIFAQWTTTGVNQEISFVDDTAVLKDDARFVISDLALGYRFAKRRGMVGFTAKNVFDKKFQYQSANSVNTSLLPNNPYQPRRTLTGNVSYNF